MNNYIGVIIEESLQDTSVLQDVRILETEEEMVTERFGTPWLSQWTLHTVEVSVEKMDAVAEEVARTIDGEHKTAWYADFKNDTYHYIIFRDKVFKVARESRAAYKEAYDYGLANGTPEHQLLQYPGVSAKRIGAFLHAANKNTYVNAKAAKSESSRAGSHDYHFEDGLFIYHDTYFGNREFMGEEVIYHAGRPIWGANYYGTMLDDDMEEATMAAFLRKALMQEYTDVIPVRGPKAFVEGEWSYRFAPMGNLDRFTGVEEIAHLGKIVFRLQIHGGFIG